MLCDHRLSAAPSQPNQRPSRAFMSVGVLRVTSAAAKPRVRLSVQLRSGTWQLPHENRPSPDRRVSKNRRSPSSSAARLPETRLLGSVVIGVGQGPCARMARISASVNCTSSATTLSAGRSAASAAKANPATPLVCIPSGYHRPVTIKSDKWIRRMAAKGMIEPFEAHQIKEVAGRRVVSYGTSSYGYDIRCSTEFKIFTNINSTIVDPKNFDEKNFVDYRGEVCIIPPNSFALARTVEYFRIPRSVLTICLGKSTYARCGIIVNVTPLEPEWEGHVTLEFSNTTPLPARVYANEGVAQVIFLESDEVCETSYRDRGGKYQGQKGVTLPRI